MRNKLNLMKSQSGQILAYTIIILMLAALIITPLLQFTYGSWRSVNLREQRTLELYAADAGIEDALYQIKTEKEGTGVGNLTYGGAPYNIGTPDMNDRDANVTVEKVWLPEGDELPPEMQTDLPTTETDKSDKLVVVGMLKTVLASAASDDFEEGWPDGNSDGWTGAWTSVNASLGSGSEGCGSSSYCLKFADVDGSATRTATVLKYMRPQLKFTARASSLEAGDSVTLKVKYDDEDEEIVETWIDGSETPTCNAFNLDLYDLYGWGGNDTQVPLQITFDAELFTEIAAQDNFDTGTWGGGLGWDGNNWQPSGSASVTSTQGLPTHSGSFHVRLAGASGSSSRGSVYRRISNISSYSGLQLLLKVYAKRTNNWESGDYAYVDMRSNERGWTQIDTWDRNELTTSYKLMTVALPYTSSATWYEIRFRANMNDSSEILYIDDVSVTEEGDRFYVDNLRIVDEYNTNMIEIAYIDAGMGEVYLDRIGVWMPPGCQYVGVEEDETTDALELEPTILQNTYADGTILEWDYGDVALHLPCCQLPIVKTLTFAYMVDLTQGVDGMFVWIAADEVDNGPPSPTDTQDDYISWDKGYEIYKAVSQASHEIFGSNTQVTAYVAQGEVEKRNAVSYGDYVATGNPLLIDYTGSSYVKEKVIDPTNYSTWVTKSGFYYDGRSEASTVPDDGEVVSAWLYWAAFMNNSDWSTYGSQPDTSVNFMYPYRYGPESFVVLAGDIASRTYIVESYELASPEPMDLVSHDPDLIMTNMRYLGEVLGNAGAHNGDDIFFTDHSPLSQSSAPNVWVGGSPVSQSGNYAINYATGEVTIINDDLFGSVIMDYSVSGSQTLVKDTDYTIISDVVGGVDTRYKGFTIINGDVTSNKLQGTVTIDYYYAKHWQAVEHAAYDRYGTALPPVEEEVPPGAGHVGHSYTCFAEVSDLLEEAAGSSGEHPGNGQYAVSDVRATPGVDGSAWDTRSFSGWSLIIVYYSTSETAHQFYLYDPIHNNDHDGTLEEGECPFQKVPNSPDTIFTLTDFYPPEGTVEGRVTYFVGEGDSVYTGDSVAFKGVSQGSYTTLSGPNNPANDVMNTVSTTGERGIDIDTYDIFSEVGSDNAANVKLSTDEDRWYVVYMVLSFKTDLLPKADFAFDVSSVTYQYELE